MQVVQGFGHGIERVCAVYVGDDVVAFDDRGETLQLLAPGARCHHCVALPLRETKYPRMAQFAGEHVMQPGYSFADSFEVGLAMVIDGAGALR